MKSKGEYIMQYLASLHESNVSFHKKGVYVDAAYYFMNNTKSVNIKGYLSFCRSQKEYLVINPQIKEGVLDFLSRIGKGFQRKETKHKTAPKVELTKRDIRCHQIIQDYLVWLEKQKDFSVHTLQVYHITAKQFFSYFDEFNQDNARRFVENMEAKGFKPSTINLRITGLEHLAKFFKKNINIKRPKKIRSLSTENIPTEKEYNRILAWCNENNPRMGFIIRLMATTGCRVSELLSFTYEQIQEGSVVLKCKGAKYRRFYFTKEMQEEAKGKNGPAVLNRFGIPYSQRALCLMLKQIGEKVEVDKKKMHPHAFRHFFAKKYLQKTKDVIALSELLGHESVDTTRLYLQKSYDEQKKEINRIVDW